MDPPTRYRTVTGELRHEIEKVKGSRFLASLAPAADVDAARAWVERVRREFHDARHTCWAFRLGPGGEVWRFHDDGEPSGSAGRPILQQIVVRELTDVVVAVTRYFGGTKLGVGGLVRAYAATAAAALDRAETRTIVVTRELVVTYPYEYQSSVQGLLAAHRLKPVAADYGQAVRLTLALPIDLAEAILRELRDRTAGRAQW